MATLTSAATVEPKITLGWEVLPAVNGMLHAVDPDPDVVVEAWPTSLCGVMLVVKDAVITDANFCAVCQEESRLRQAAFDLEVGQ